MTPFPSCRPAQDTSGALLPLFGALTSVTVGLELNAVVICSLMLSSIVKVAKTYVTEAEEWEFMEACRAFAADYRPGDRPPAPRRTFAVHWARRCERHWRRAFRLFTAGACSAAALLSYLTCIPEQLDAKPGQSPFLCEECAI